MFNIIINVCVCDFIAGEWGLLDATPRLPKAMQTESELCDGIYAANACLI